MPKLCTFNLLCNFLDFGYVFIIFWRLHSFALCLWTYVAVPHYGNYLHCFWLPLKLFFRAYVAKVIVTFLLCNINFFMDSCSWLSCTRVAFLVQLTIIFEVKHLIMKYLPVHLFVISNTLALGNGIFVTYPIHWRKTEAGAKPWNFIAMRIAFLSRTVLYCKNFLHHWGEDA